MTLQACEPMDGPQAYCVCKTHGPGVHFIEKIYHKVTEAVCPLCEPTREGNPVLGLSGLNLFPDMSIFSEIEKIAGEIDEIENMTNVLLEHGRQRERAR